MNKHWISNNNYILCSFGIYKKSEKKSWNISDQHPFREQQVSYIFLKKCFCTNLCNKKYRNKSLLYFFVKNFLKFWHPIKLKEEIFVLQNYFSFYTQIRLDIILSIESKVIDSKSKYNLHLAFFIISNELFMQFTKIITINLRIL